MNNKNNGELTVVEPVVGLRPEALLQILEVTRKLAAPFDLPAVLNEIGEAARSPCCVPSARRSGSSNRTRRSSCSRLPRPMRRHHGQRSRKACWVSRPARGRSSTYPMCHDEPLFDPAVDLDYNHDVRCMLSVPLVERSHAGGCAPGRGSRLDGPFTAEDERVAETLATQCVVFIQRERMSRSLVQAEKLDREIKLAREIQMSTLPSEMPRVPDYDMAGQFCPADETGGDTFDLVPLDDHRLFVLLGDASGHGIGPALSATQMTGMLRVALRLGADLDCDFRPGQQPARRGPAGGALRHRLPRHPRYGAACVDFHAAGQGPILHFEAATAPATGMRPRPSRWVTCASRRSIRRSASTSRPGDILALISDGVFEAENPAGAMFGVSGVEDILREGTAHRPMTERAGPRAAGRACALGRREPRRTTSPWC